MLGSIESVRYSRQYPETCVRRHIIKRFIVTLTVAALAALATAQDEPITPEQFAQENPEPAFQLHDGDLNPVGMLELAYQCLGTGAQAVGDNLVVTGFDMVDARAYQLRGARSLQTALRRAEVNAQAQAAQFFEAVRVRASTVVSDTELETSQDAMQGDEVLSQFSMQTVNELSVMNETSVEAYLRGGRKTGTKVISLGEEGMCVGVRYELPLDQDNFDPVERAQEEALPTVQPEPDTEEEGRQAPPAGEIGDW